MKGMEIPQIQHKTASTVKKDRDSTKMKKKAFLEAYWKNVGRVYQTAEKVCIDPSTYYEWIKSDVDFRAKIHELDRRKMDMTEDVIFQGIFEKKDLPTARWYAEVTSPKYRKTQVIEHHTDDKSFEDVVDTIVERMNNKKPKKNDSRIKQGDAPSPDRGEPAHQEQA